MTLPRKYLIKGNGKLGRIKATIKKWLQVVLNPRFLLCYGMAWMITNGWAYLCAGIGTWCDWEWLAGIAGSYLALVRLPLTPDKIAMLTIAIFLLRRLFPHDEKRRVFCGRCIPKPK